MKAFATILLCLVFSVAAADAKDKGKGKGHGNHANRGSSPAAVVNVRFGTRDVRLIREYYGAQPMNLPPGLQKKVARGKPLPPGWQRKLQPFPSDIAMHLSGPCDYCGRGVIDGYGVVYDKRTAIILDAVRLAGDILR